MKKIVFVCLCVLCLFGCGKRGKLEFPPGSTYPHQYPAPRKPFPERMIQQEASNADETIQNDINENVEEMKESSSEMENQE